MTRLLSMQLLSVEIVDPIGRAGIGAAAEDRCGETRSLGRDARR